MKKGVQIVIIVLICIGLVLGGVYGWKYYDEVIRYPQFIVVDEAVLDQALSNKIVFPEEAYLLWNKTEEYFEAGKFKASYQAYGGTYEDISRLTEEMVTDYMHIANIFKLSDGAYAQNPNWMYVKDRKNNSIDEQDQEKFDAGMPYMGILEYQNGSFFLIVYIYCSDPKNAESMGLLYQAIAEYVNQNITDERPESNAVIG